MTCRTSLFMFLVESGIEKYEGRIPLMLQIGSVEISRIFGIIIIQCEYINTCNTHIFYSAPFYKSTGLLYCPTKVFENLIKDMPSFQCIYVIILSALLIIIRRDEKTLFR